MTLQEAIEIQSAFIKSNTCWPTGELKTAMELGIEALKFVEADRVKYPYVKVPLLPGETRE